METMSHAEERMKEHSGSPKPTQGTFEVPTIKTKVNSKDFPHMKLTVKSSLQDFQKLMKEKLCDHMEILEVFRRDSPFGAFLDVQLVPPPAMLWQLMVREANVEGAKGSEMWFVVNGVPIRYSLMEFSLITGLKCSQLAPGYKEQYDKDSLPFFVKENWSKGVVCYTSVVERFSKLCQLLDDEGKKEYALQWIVKVATLMFVVLVLIGHAKKDAPVPKWILATVANSDDSMSFPWGTWAFLESLRIQSLGKDLVSEKRSLSKAGIHQTPSDTLALSSPHPSILLPEGSEIRAPWITSLTSLPSVSNPTLGEFVRGIQGGDKNIQLCMKKQLLTQASEDEVAVGRNSSSDEVHSSSEGSEVPSKKYVLRRRQVSKPCTPHGKAEHTPMLERTTNIKASSLSGNSSQIFPNSLKDYIDGKFSELQKTLCQEVENFLERIFQTLEERILLTLLVSSKGRTDEAKEDDGKKEEPVEVNEVNHSIHEGVDHNEEDEIKDGKEEDEKVDPPYFEWVDHNEEAIKDGKEEEPMGVNTVDPYSFDGVDHNEEEKKMGKKKMGRKKLGRKEMGRKKMSPLQKIWSSSPEEEEKFAVEGEANEDEMAMSDKIVHDVVEFCKSTENNVDEKVESNGDVLRELTDVDEVAAARVKVINSNVSNELDKAEEEKLNIRRNPSSQQLEAFHQFIQSAIADGREVQCIMEKRGESHGIVKKWWSSLIKAGGWLETTHMEEIMIYFMKMYNKKDRTYAVLLESFQMLGEVNATTELFPILDTGLAEIVLVFGKDNWVTYPIRFPEYDSGEDDDDIQGSFVHKLEAHNVIPKESYLELPRSFCANNGISDGTMNIKIYGPEMFPNEVTLSVKESGCRLSKGWHNFVEDNGLRLGDKVVLTFIAENTIIVYAFRHRMLPRLTNY
ncbi:unnamed protein product [Cuscuta campestris]|uniref:TF-B3 domain-containing protein n=1 Tax=Cuscuta campestris TaxID=132261 RepID=A0A484N406_9ASTE|nr:unnamed protein product [Cuscuta campestris]